VSRTVAAILTKFQENPPASAFCPTCGQGADKKKPHPTRWGLVQVNWSV
jgi:hypothetical protein